ncbi:hypothetical protein TSAR_006906, partial [Trichomalopsis sarcophagae]
EKKEKKRSALFDRIGERGNRGSRGRDERGRELKELAAATYDDQRQPATASSTATSHTSHVKPKIVSDGVSPNQEDRVKNNDQSPALSASLSLMNDVVVEEKTGADNCPIRERQKRSDDDDAKTLTNGHMHHRTPPISNFIPICLDSEIKNFEEGKSDKEILDNLLLSTRYDKRLLPPVQDADFCCGMRWPGDAAALEEAASASANISSSFFPTSTSSSSSSSSGSIDGSQGVAGVRQSKNQNKNHHYTPHQHLRTHLRGTLTVNVSVLLLSLASPDESSLKYEVEFLLQQQWYDPRLRYSNRSRYEFLNAIHHHNDIWLPDTYFIMHGDFKDPLIPVHFALRIYRNGTVNYLMRRHLILSCQGRLNIFPFDDPLCSFAIESSDILRADSDHVRVEERRGHTAQKPESDDPQRVPHTESDNHVSDQSQLARVPHRQIVAVLFAADGQLIVDYEDEYDDFGDSKCSLCQRRFEEQGNYSCLKVDLIFTRDRAFYFTTVFIPGIILVTSSFITFWLEWNAVPARVMIGVTTMLNFFTTSNGFRSTLPVVSNLTAMNVWDGVCMCFIYASLLEFVCVNYVGRKRPLHNVVYRPGENPVTQRNVDKLLISKATSRDWRSCINLPISFLFYSVSLSKAEKKEEKTGATFSYLLISSRDDDNEASTE